MRRGRDDRRRLERRGGLTAGGLASGNAPTEARSGEYPAGIEGLAHLDHGGAVSQHVELRGGRVGQIDDAVTDEGSAVVDAYHELRPFCKLVTRT